MPDASITAAIAADYDAIAYDARPHPMSHPDNVAPIATMFGLDAPDVATARVLEVGCNDGSNLLPMAASLPGATFVGCDIAHAAIERANHGANALGLANVRFVEADLSALQEGPWDYVVAHGVYSWVPTEVRDALFALLARSLRANGLAFVSYNTLPGGYVRRAASEALRWHVRAGATRADKLRDARALATLLADAGPTQEGADASVRQEFVRIAAEPDSALYHDTLAEPNEPVWFHAFAAHAVRHDLAYVAEALPSMMAGAGLPPGMRDFLGRQDRLAREQYLDIARLRRFRQSILARRSAAGHGQLVPERMAKLFVSAAMPLRRAAIAGQSPGATLAGPDASTFRALLERLVDAAPGAMSVAELCASVPTAGGRPAGAVLVEAWASGYAQLHTAPPTVAVVPGARPRGGRVARWQAPRQDTLTNLRHEAIRLPEPFARRLLALCDGQRDRTALAMALADGRHAAGVSLAAQIDDTLRRLAQAGLLEA
jgi:SAM-dependent methyltransferase